MASALLERILLILPSDVEAMYRAAMRIYTDPWFYSLIGAILFVEHLRPAIREQRVFSRALAHDFLWFNLDGAFRLAVLPLFIGLLQVAYTRVTGGFTVTGSGAWPVWLVVAVSFLLSDFLNWFHHVVRHRVKAFWHFHVIHHSQREMNAFTDLRVHLLESIIALTITFFPLFLLAANHPVLMGYGVAMAWYTRFIHANIRTNLGPLRHVLVTPQYHRVHHSIEARHRDRNFGVTLTVWDRLFGTMYPHYDEYPATGVEGVEFRPPEGVSPRAWLKTLWDQLAYPFRRLLVGRRDTAPAGETPVPFV